MSRARKTRPDLPAIRRSKSKREKRIARYCRTVALAFAVAIAVNVRQALRPQPTPPSDKEHGDY